jgi:transposase
MTFDELIEPGHPARAVWSYVEGLDLGPLYDRVRSREGLSGRPAIDPRLLVALWLYATLSGFTSAREVAELCRRHDAFRWLAGGVSVNHHTLSDFRGDGPGFLDGLLNESVERLRSQGVIDLDRVAQDGVRVRASAGAASFHRRETLGRQLGEALAEAQRLQQRAADAPQGDGGQGVAIPPGPAGGPAGAARGEAAQLRHAEDRLDRVDRALDRLAEVEAKAGPGGVKRARASTTDPDATVMKMPDGGYRPAYNVQFGTACGGLVIVGVDVLRVGSDQGQLPPMLEQVEGRFGQRPGEALVDGGFVNKADIEGVQAGGRCKVFAPVPTPRKEGVDRHVPKAADGDGVAEWRARMGTEQGKEVYKQRAATAECVNAQARNRGLVQLLVRGLAKVKSVATWFAIAHNMARCFALQPQPDAAMDS